MSTTTRAIPGKTTFALAARVKNSWETHPTLFADYKVSKTDFESAIIAAEQADSLARTTKVEATAEKDRLQAVYREVVAKAKKELADGLITLKARLDTVNAERNAALLELARHSNGARYFAKSSALSDGDVANDAAGREI